MRLRARRASSLQRSRVAFEIAGRPSRARLGVRSGTSQGLDVHGKRCTPATRSLAYRLGFREPSVTAGIWFGQPLTARPAALTR